MMEFIISVCIVAGCLLLINTVGNKAKQVYIIPAKKQVYISLTLNFHNDDFIILCKATTRQLSVLNRVETSTAEM
jgi:hypothetical protein